MPFPKVLFGFNCSIRTESELSLICKNGMNKKETKNERTRENVNRTKMNSIAAVSIFSENAL